MTHREDLAMKIRRREQAVHVMPEPMAGAGSVPMVDAALRVAAGRQLFTRTEALNLLRQVEAEASGNAAAAVHRIVSAVDADSADRMMLNRVDLLDPLLDIRLAIGS